MHGHQMMQEITERTEGIWRPSPGSVCPTLQQLEDVGLVQADAQVARTGSKGQVARAKEILEDARRKIYGSSPRTTSRQKAKQLSQIARPMSSIP
jgi:DNA-binding PadR family transcriptional regulator